MKGDDALWSSGSALDAIALHEIRPDDYNLFATLDPSVMNTVSNDGLILCQLSLINFS